MAKNIDKYLLENPWMRVWTGKERGGGKEGGGGRGVEGAGEGEGEGKGEGGDGHGEGGGGLMQSAHDEREHDGLEAFALSDGDAVGERERSVETNGR